MINYQAIKEEIEQIKRMPIEHLFEYGQKLFVNIKIYEEQDRTERFISEIESDRIFAKERYFKVVVNTIMKKKYGITYNVGLCRGYYFATFNEYLDGCVSRFFLHSMQKDNVFCRKVVEHYILSTSINRKIDIAKEVDRWIDYHNSEEFKESIAVDVFSINHYIMGLAKMVNDCFNDERANKNA